MSGRVGAAELVNGFACGVTSSVQRRPIQPAPMPCSSPTTPAPSLAATSLSAGHYRSACSISSPNSATGRTGFRLATVPAYWALSAISAWTAIGAVEKEEMRALVLRGGPWSDAERAQIFDYCESDMAALARLLPAWCLRSTCRGRSCAAVTWLRLRGWSAMACRSMSARSSCSRKTGTRSRTN